MIRQQWDHELRTQHGGTARTSDHDPESPAVANVSPTHNGSEIGQFDHSNGLGTYDSTPAAAPSTIGTTPTMQGLADGVLWPGEVELVGVRGLGRCFCSSLAVMEQPILAVCNGAKRSGSTLQFNLTRSLLDLAGKGNGGGFFTPGQLADFDLNRMMQHEEWIVIKAHHVEPAILSAASQSSRCVILFTYRDLRDVAVSAQRFWKLSWDDTTRPIETILSPQRRT